jgi:uncharacterized membrane protein YfcA
VTGQNPTPRRDSGPRFGTPGWCSSQREWESSPVFWPTLEDFLLAPAYARFLRQPVKKSFACSLAVAAVLAVPGTIVHAYLGHISWTVAIYVALGSAPSSYLGAWVAIRTKASRLERLYGIVLTALGAFFLYQL